MNALAIQYLESDPGSSLEFQEKVRSKLHMALDLPPISLVLIGWEVSVRLIQICRDETNIDQFMQFRTSSVTKELEKMT